MVSPYKVLFGMAFATTLLSAYIGAFVIYNCVKLLGGDEYTANTRSTVYVSYCCTMLIKLCPWIKIVTADGEPLDWAATRQGGRAPFLLMNHTSFIDFFVFSSMAPHWLYAEASLRTMIKAGLFKVPLYGSTVGVRCGSFPVHFKSDEVGSFKVDQEKQAPVQAKIDAHIARGGSIALCPEGQISASPPNVQSFRRGSFAVPIANEMPIWGLTMVGCFDAWGKHETMGGHPTTIVVSLDNLHTPKAADGAAEVAQICQDKMQAAVERCLVKREAILGKKAN